MALIGSMTMPRFSEEERDAMRRIDGVLVRHPYMRADLGGASEIERELEDVLSARLALLHAEGASGAARTEAPLATKLRDWEAQLLTAVSERPGSERTVLRYETALLLHPNPTAAPDASAARPSRARLTSAWERWRQERAFGDTLTEKLRQSHDFFRHGAMLPWYWRRRRRIRKLVPRSVRDHPALRETLFAIEQVGPLIDNFAFKGAAGIPLSARVGLADVAFLYMQLADEFLDELAVAVGGFDKAGRLVGALYRADTSKRPLRSLSLQRLSKAGVDAHAHGTKYGLTLGELFDVLRELADVIDALLKESSADVVHAVHLFLHHCFETYLDEVDLCERAPDGRADRLNLRDAAWHFYRKNNMVMMLWLDLRARLLGLVPSEHSAAIRRWGYMLASFQIFDDLKDIALDLGKQPNYALQVAANDFPAEFAWLERRFGASRAPVTRDDVREINHGACRTVLQCMQWSRLIALAHFDNALLYAWDQRWRKSWTRRRNSFNPDGVAPPRRNPGHVVDRLVRALLATRSRETEPAVKDEQFAFALDTSAYDGSWRIYVALFPNIRAMYRFATLRMCMTADEKARAARRLLRRYPRARANALLDLADADVHHQVTRDGLEAFAKLIEA